MIVEFTHPWFSPGEAGLNTQICAEPPTSGSASACSFRKITPPSGDVTKVGTPVDDQIGVWTGDGSIEGTTFLTSDGTELSINDGVLFIKEQAEADADKAGYGQLWINTATPNEFY